MNGETIKQFLVGLGFGVDEKSFKGFMKSVGAATLKVTLMATAVKAAAAGAFFGIAKISEGFEEIGYQYRIIAPAINKAILLRKAMMSAYKEAGINIVQAVQQSIKFNMALAKTKFQLEAIVKSTAMKFVPTLTKQMDIFRTKVSANMPKILALLERFVKFVFKAFEGVVILGTRLWSMLGRVWDLLEKLDNATGGWSTKILGLIAVWKLLNLSFLATPLGMLLVGLLALLALYDDFMTWKEGGESLFDWGGDAVKTVAGVTAAVAGMVAIFYAAKAAITGWAIAAQAAGAIMSVLSGVMKVVRAGILLFNLALYANPIGLIIAAVASLIALLAVLYMKWDVIKKSFSDFFTGLGGKALSAIGNLFGGENITNVENMKNTMPSTSPLGSTSNTNNSSQVIKQETNITVQGSTNPEGTARAIGSEQSKVNFNMARNMKGAAR